MTVDQRTEEERVAQGRLEDDGDVEEDEDKMWTEQYVSKQTRLEIEACLSKLQVSRYVNDLNGYIQHGLFWVVSSSDIPFYV